MTFLGIDIGSTAVKAVLVDDGGVRADSDFPLFTTYANDGAVEQNPEDWWTAALAAIDGIRAADGDGFAALRGIGLTGQPQATVLIDVADRLIRPAMTWNDTRALNEATLLDRQIPDLVDIAGAAATSAATAAKLLWLREHEPQNFERIGFVLAAKDFIRLRLTGEHATDVSDAAPSLLLAEKERDWSGTAVAASGLTRAALPTLLESPAWSGMVRSELLADWGIGHQVVVAAGASAVGAAAIGIGAITEGDAFIALDAGAQIVVARNAYRAPATLATQALAHALPDRWFDTAAPANAMLCLDWLAGFVGERDVGQLIARLDGAAGPSPLLYVPDLAGERAPFSDPEARGGFSTVVEANGQREMTQAVLDGVAFRLHDAIDDMGHAFPAGPVPVAGEGARHGAFLSVVASVLGRPLLRVANADKAMAIGAARLGRMAATGETAATVASEPALAEIVDPVPELEQAYAKRRGEFRAFATSLRKVSDSRATTAGRRRRARG